jgi:hypothetical protein
MTDLIYGSLEGVPTVYVEGSGGKAYWYMNGKWKPATGTDGADIFTKSAIMSKPAFDELFGKLPSPPQARPGSAIRTRPE